MEKVHQLYLTDGMQIEYTIVGVGSPILIWLGKGSEALREASISFLDAREER